MRRPIFTAGLAITLMAVANLAQAGMLTTSLGNTSSGFNDGDTVEAPAIGTAQAGQPAPFDSSKGNDISTDNVLDESWTFNYAAIADPIVTASLSFGIWDHDSAATGDQLADFRVDGNDLTATLNPLFEADASGDLVYNVYTLALDSLLADLADGSLTVELTLAAPGLVTPLFPLPGPNPVEESVGNGGALIFSTLMIETRDGEVPVPGPGALSLGLLAFGSLIWRRRTSPGRT